VGIAASRTIPSSVDDEGRETDLSKLRGAAADIQNRLVAAKARVVTAQGTVDAARRERSSLAHWFQRQAGTRTAAVEQARAQIRRCSVALARKALSEPVRFDADVRSACSSLSTLENAAASAARDVAVHQAALTAYNAHAVRVGIVTLLVFAIALAACPFAWRGLHNLVLPALLGLGR
jgi:hypothetical protein